MKKVIILLLALMSASTVLGQQKVAVYVTGGNDAGISKVLGDQLVAAFASSGKYTAIERTSSFLVELGKEQNYQRTGAVDDRELSRLGKQFGVQLVCIAEVTDVLGEKYFSTRLIDVESAEVVNTSNFGMVIKNMNTLLTVSKKITSELTGKTAQEQASAAAVKNKEKEDIETFKKSGYLPVGNLYIQSKSLGEVEWEIANRMCQNSTIGGYNDWRLPTIVELMQIYTLRKDLNINFGFDSKTFEKKEIWSADAGSKAKHIIMEKGKTDESKKTAICFCVRNAEK
jgi:hypothetical protein